MNYHIFLNILFFVVGASVGGFSMLRVSKKLIVQRSHKQSLTQKIIPTQLSYKDYSKNSKTTKKSKFESKNVLAFPAFDDVEFLESIN